MSAFDQVRVCPATLSQLFPRDDRRTHTSRCVRVRVVQYLDEDPRTNRIDDSLQLFTAICQNKLLAKAALVLMLNKVRILISLARHGAEKEKTLTGRLAQEETRVRN